VPLLGVLEDITVLLVRQDHPLEREPARGCESRLEPFDHVREPIGSHGALETRLDQLRQLFAELADNIGHDLAYTHGEAPSYVATRVFETGTCEHYAGASLMLSPTAVTTSGRTYTPNYRGAAGLPSQNTGRFVSEGVIQDATGITTRSSLPLGGNPGGLPEVLIPNPANQVRLTGVSGVNPPF
jgi:hypothetical protein